MSIPTAPLHEFGVGRFVREFVARLGLTAQADAYGNLIVVYRHGKTRQPLAFVAHMDHPALEITAVRPGQAAALLLGGVNPDCFARPVAIRVFHAEAEVGAEVFAATVEEPRVVRLHLRTFGEVAVGDFGVFDLPDFRREDDLLHMRAADDLVGCAASLLALAWIVRRGIPAELHAVFTRAEEIGLVGATLLAEAGTIPRKAIVVSLEASKELPGAVLGGGPVIRVGDAASAFHPEGEALLLGARAQLRASKPDVAIQRQLMSGGTCEATAFGLQGYRTTGVAIPLGNYHNVAPEHRIAPEYVHFQDFLTEVDLLVAAAEVAAQPPKQIWPRFEEAANRWRDRLSATARQFGVVEDA